jgi:hypothetical protein
VGLGTVDVEHVSWTSGIHRTARSSWTAWTERSDVDDSCIVVERGRSRDSTQAGSLKDDILLIYVYNYSGVCYFAHAPTLATYSRECPVMETRLSRQYLLRYSRVIKCHGLGVDLTVSNLDFTTVPLASEVLELVPGFTVPVLLCSTCGCAISPAWRTFSRA